MILLTMTSIQGREGIRWIGPPSRLQSCVLYKDLQIVIGRKSHRTAIPTEPAKDDLHTANATTEEKEKISASGSAQEKTRAAAASSLLYVRRETNGLQRARSTSNVRYRQ